jgi:hypothetical protein
MMKTLAGLWIDHREAVIVLLSEKGQEMRRIKNGQDDGAPNFAKSAPALSGVSRHPARRPEEQAMNTKD